MLVFYYTFGPREIGMALLTCKVALYTLASTEIRWSGQEHTKVADSGQHWYSYMLEVNIYTVARLQTLSCRRHYISWDSSKEFAYNSYCSFIRRLIPIHFIQNLQRWASKNPKLQAKNVITVIEYSGNRPISWISMNHNAEQCNFMITIKSIVQQKNSECDFFFLDPRHLIEKWHSFKTTCTRLPRKTYLPRLWELPPVNCVTKHNSNKYNNYLTHTSISEFCYFRDMLLSGGGCTDAIAVWCRSVCQRTSSTFHHKPYQPKSRMQTLLHRRLKSDATL